MEEVSLRIGDKVFKANKQLLCEFSDYFRAMFSGNYVESEKQEISIDVLEPNIMSIILKYMQMGMILLSEYPLSTIGEIAIAANFLQITELIKQIEFVLDNQLSESNWVQTMAIAQKASYSQLEQNSVAYGLHSFNSMKKRYIPTIHKLVWYLSHPYLDSPNEYQVFKFGFKWFLKYHLLEHTRLLLACLDIKRVTKKILIDIGDLVIDYLDYFEDGFHLVLQIINCLKEITSKDLVISEVSLTEHKTELCKKFSESAWSESISIVRNSRSRLIKYVPVVPLWILKDQRPELLPHCLYTFEEDKGFEKYLEVADKHLWGWSVTAWGSTKLVVVCGEHGRGSGIFMRDVKVYDTLKKKWTHFGVQLPPRRHAGVTTLGDLLYIVGGVGEFRVVLETAVVYDLKGRSCRSIAKLPDAIQSPAVCTHNNTVYAAGHKHIYYYDNYKNKDKWKIAAKTDVRITLLRSYNSYIYCMQSYFRRLYRFLPCYDEELKYITSFTNLPAAMCNLGNHCLMVFTRTDDGDLTVEEYKEVAVDERTDDDDLTVEEYKEYAVDEKPRFLAIQAENMRVNDVAGSCTLIMKMPQLCAELPLYHRQYLMQHFVS